MNITNKHNIIQSTYTIHNHNLETTDTAKYLGIHINNTLNWNTHINKTAQRTNTTEASLHRNTTHLAYTTMVRPIIEYASIIWDPHAATNIHTLETVQRRSARHIMHNYNRHASATITSISIVFCPPLFLHKMYTLLLLYEMLMCAGNKLNWKLNAPEPWPTYTTTTPPFQNHHVIQNQTPTSQHSNCNLHHTIN